MERDKNEPFKQSDDDDPDWVKAIAPGPMLGEIPGKSAGPHGALDVPTVSIGAVLRPLASDDDLLGEMLEERS